MGSHSVTCHPTQVNPTLTTAIPACTWFTYPRGMEGWVDPVQTESLFISVIYITLSYHSLLNCYNRYFISRMVQLLTWMLSLQ